MHANEGAARMLQKMSAYCYNYQQKPIQLDLQPMGVRRQALVIKGLLVSHKT
jgi:hypothetical protein